MSVAEEEFPVGVRLAGVLMLVGAAWNALIALMFMGTWIASLFLAPVALFYMPLIALNAYSAVVGLQLILGQRVKNAHLVPLASSGLGFFLLCGMAAVVPDGAAALVLHAHLDDEETDDAPRQLTG